MCVHDKLLTECLAGWRLTAKCQTLPLSDHDLIRAQPGTGLPWEPETMTLQCCRLQWTDGSWRLHLQVAEESGCRVKERERGAQAPGGKFTVTLTTSSSRLPTLAQWRCQANTLLVTFRHSGFRKRKFMPQVWLTHQNFPYALSIHNLIDQS